MASVSTVSQVDGTLNQGDVARKDDLLMCQRGAHVKPASVAFERLAQSRVVLTNQVIQPRLQRCHAFSSDGSLTHRDAPRLVH